MTRGGRRAFAASSVVALAAVATLLGPMRTDSRAGARVRVVDGVAPSCSTTSWPE